MSIDDIMQFNGLVIITRCNEFILFNVDMSILFIGFRKYWFSSFSNLMQYGYLVGCAII